ATTDVTVALSSSDPLVFTVPPTVTVTAGSTAAGFPIAFSPDPSKIVTGVPAGSPFAGFPISSAYLGVNAVTTVTITATMATNSFSTPLTFTPQTPIQIQNDMGSGRDAGDPTPVLLTLSATPLIGTGAILSNFGDHEDVYTFMVPQAFQLLTMS